ncbi:ABC transporter substrate-binding protein [Clostridium aminobutyricum]|uniref:Solute-binding protein family 5 domain-containing protein n=1 Tax=Clostridium aminobutyricum TaxID=33953 RepID=A0A939D7B7_CLOAM|nr:ABC transporter substrate-binding protein [Clostridium aminobutyricum]MBN7772432.1 hypothetical protein [Clostridium aminobutyricum]
MIKKLVSIIACLTIAFSFSACRNAADFFKSNDEEKVTYTESNTVNLQMEKARSLNPVISKDEDTFQISKLIYESLFTFDKNLSLVNNLASDYVYSADKLSVSITIKNNSYFSDGTNLTADDVKFSIESYMDAAASNNTIYKDYVSNIKSVSVEKGNRYLVKIKFKNTNNVAMDHFTFPILPEHLFKKGSAAKSTSSNFIPVGSGPYKVESYNDISELKLVANENYNGTKIKNNLSFTVLPEREDVIPLIEVNNISIGFLNEMSRDTLIADKKLNKTNLLSNEAEVIGFNFAKENMANKKLRQAIAYALDNQAINENAYYKNGVLSDTIYYPGYLGTKNTGDHYKFDLETAAKLLVSAGFADRDGNGYLEGADDKELSIDILVNSQDQNRVIAAEAVKSSLDKLKIFNRIVYANGMDEYNAKLNSENYDIFIGGMKINEMYDLRPLLHSDYSNLIGYSNKKVDTLLDKLKSGISAEEQIKTVESLKEILEEDLPYYCIIYKTYGALTAKCLQSNEKEYSFNNLYRGCEKWYCKYVVTKTPQVVDSTDTEEEPV